MGDEILPDARQWTGRRYNSRKRRVKIDHSFHFAREAPYQPSNLFTEEWIGVDKALLSSNIQVATPKPEVFDFTVFDRASLLKKTKKFSDERGFALKFPQVTISDEGIEEHTLKCAEDPGC